jgi:hypothetical protein
LIGIDSDRLFEAPGNLAQRTLFSDKLGLDIDCNGSPDKTYKQPKRKKPKAEMRFPPKNKPTVKKTDDFDFLSSGKHGKTRSLTSKYMIINIKNNPPDIGTKFASVEAGSKKTKKAAL